MLNEKPKVLFITGLLSPFQIELASEINKINLFDYYVAFTVPYSQRRGKHWMIRAKDNYSKYISIANKEMTTADQALWAAQIIEQIDPKIVISGSFKGPVLRQISRAKNMVGCKLALWGESPNLLYAELLVKIYIHFVLQKNLRNMHFILGIGDRAVKIYKGIFSSKDVHLIPYAQDLTIHLNIERRRKSVNDKIVFLFSGQLIKRHNIRLLAKVLIELYKKNPEKFKFVIAGYGPEESVFRRIIMREPKLKKHIIYDRDYKKWEDRIHPFSYSDVLVYPSRHSGWGLVVPEAMASGMVVLSTPYVEASRYYIRNGINGILIEPTAEQLFLKMEWCINNKERIFEMGQQARIDSQEATARKVAKKFCRVIQKYL